jgi:hypothetical protein
MAQVSLAPMLRRLALAALLLSSATPAWAGPPYDTDDPDPTDVRHWEIYTFVGGVRGGGAFEGTAGFDLNYGPLPGVQLTATLPLDFTRGPGARTAPGDVEFGVKYRFVHSERAGFSIAAFPRVILPTARGGSGKAGLLLPLWASKAIGHWSLFGGGGYAINPGSDNRNYWQCGAALTRDLTERLSLGLEATHHGPDAIGGHPTTTLGVGAIYHLKGPFSLLASAGPSFAGHDGDKYHAYLALGLNF